MKTKERLLIYIGIIAVIIISSFFWGSPGQEINMRQARREINKVKELLKGDERFTNIKLAYSTADLGRAIFVYGTLSDKESLVYLKELIEKSMSPKFRIGYSVKIEANAKESSIIEADTRKKQVGPIGGSRQN